MQVFPVVAPPIRKSHVTAAALDRMVLLDIAQAPDLWPQYLAGVGLAGYRPRRMQTFDNAQAMYEAAANGLGLALASREWPRPTCRQDGSPNGSATIRCC